MLIGKKLMDIPNIEGIKYLGFISEEEKLDAFRDAILSVQPSPYESLSFTTLESFSQRTPVLVNGHCDVLLEHVRLSDGGVSYLDEGQFIEGFEKISADRRLRRRMGDGGCQYMNNHFTWDIVMSRIREVLQSLLPQHGDQ